MSQTKAFVISGET